MSRQCIYCGAYTKYDAGPDEDPDFVCGSCTDKPIASVETKVETVTVKSYRLEGTLLRGLLNIPRNAYDVELQLDCRADSDRIDLAEVRAVVWKTRREEEKIS